MNSVPSGGRKSSTTDVPHIYLPNAFCHDQCGIRMRHLTRLFSWRFLEWAGSIPDCVLAVELSCLPGHNTLSAQVLIPTTVAPSYWREIKYDDKDTI